MRDRTIEDQLTKYLADVHSTEVQALAQVKAAPKLAGGGRLADAFRRHLDETAEHERLVRAQLQHRGADSSTLTDVAGFAYAFEHLEIAATRCCAAWVTAPATPRPGRSPSRSCSTSAAPPGVSPPPGTPPSTRRSATS
jgi:ferritin-like metal-binding protein YciE